MITRVVLDNFQAHKHLDLELGDLTCFTGPSNAGKSAVLRALAGMLRNDSVSEYVRHGAKTCSVTVYLDDEHVIKWTKGDGNGINDYHITRPDGSVSDLKKVGTNVPEEVVDIMRLSPILLEDGKTKAAINIHEQSDKPFLVFDTAPSNAKIFGELTSAGKLFSAANEGIRRTREDKKRKTMRQEDIDKLREDLAQYENIEEQQEALASARDKITSVQKLSQAHTSLSGLLSEHREVSEAIESAQLSISKYSKIEDLDLDELTQTTSTIGSVQAAFTEHTTITAQLAKLDALAGPLETAAAVDLDALDKITGAIKQLERLLTDYQGHQYQIGNEDLSIEDAEAELAKVQTELDEVEACPTCGQSLDEHAREQILHA